MTRARRLNSAEIERGLRSLKSWRHSRKALRRQFKFETFARAIRFVVEVAASAERLNHHPDVDIRFSLIRVALSTHDVGGISNKDFQLARLIESHARQEYPI